MPAGNNHRGADNAAGNIHRAGARLRDARVRMSHVFVCSEQSAMKLAWILWLASAFNNAASDRACLAATVYLEARGEPVTGQLAVAEVGLRRRDGGQWGNSLCKVLRARGQFALSTTSKNYVFDDTDAWQQAWLVAGFALDLWKLPVDWRPSIVPNADHFYAADGVAMPPGWAKGPPLAVIGDHRFYHAD
jgi:spore germination cell wall hydrolase CwlJ-like protein